MNCILKDFCHRYSRHYEYLNGEYLHTLVNSKHVYQVLATTNIFPIYLFVGVSSLVLVDYERCEIQIGKVFKELRKIAFYIKSDIFWKIVLTTIDNSFTAYYQRNVI